LDGSKARGVDGKTKRQYGEDLESNLADLLQRLHRGTYRPQPKRGILIPKANGKMRPIAISSFEDKLVEWVVGRILSLVYEPLFIQNSFGFRPRRGAHDALKAACVSLNDDERPYVVEIDLKSFFEMAS
jgi:RNA-directed DNA polymerase